MGYLTNGMLRSLQIFLANSSTISVWRGTSVLYSSTLINAVPPTLAYQVCTIFCEMLDESVSFHMSAKALMIRSWSAIVRYGCMGRLKIRFAASSLTGKAPGA
jgi:hypothetical protein